jgi:hypothetical protein
MASIGEAVRQQLDELIADLLAQDARTLTGMGISKQRRNYFKNSDVTKKKKLPPTDAVLAALILLGREIIVEGVSTSKGTAVRYSIAAFEQPGSALPDRRRRPVQMSLLAGLDFPPESTATIQRAERKGPHRIELLLNVEIEPKAS